MQLGQRDAVDGSCGGGDAGAEEHRRRLPAAGTVEWCRRPGPSRRPVPASGEQGDD